MALKVPAVSCAVRAIAEATACLPISVYRSLPDGGREVAADHPVMPLLQGAWNDWTGSYDGLLAATTDALTNDAGALVWVNRIDGRPRELIRYKPGSFTVDRDISTDEPVFRLATADSGAGVLPIGDVINVRAFGGSQRCPLTLAREAIGVALAMERHASKLFERGARPSGVLKFKRRLDDATFGRLQKSWGNSYSGENAGRTAILEDDADFQALTFSSTDAQFLELRQFQIVEIARAFKIPVHMLQDMSRSTWSNITHQAKEFLVYSLQPHLKAWESALNRALLSADERAAGYQIAFDVDDLTQADLGERATAYSSLIASRVIAPNTAREWEGLPPVPEGEAFINPNITPGAPEAPAKPRAVA